MIGFSEGRFLIHSIPFTVVARPSASGKNNRSDHRLSKKVVPFLINTAGSLKTIMLTADGLRQAAGANVRHYFLP